MLSLLFTLAAATAVPEPTLAIMRLYTPHAKIFLDNIQKDPTLIAEGGPYRGIGFTILNHGGKTAPEDACAQVARARKLGLYAFPGMRLYKSNGVDVLATAKWWKGRADVLERLLKCATVAPNDVRISIDAEDYGKTAVLSVAALKKRGVRITQLKKWMAAFLRPLRRRGVTVALYPVRLDDEAHLAIANAPPTVEIWDERSFGATDDFTRGDCSYGAIHIVLARARSKYLGALPHAQIRYGLKDGFLRAQGHQARLKMAGDLGPLVPWVFRYWRQPDESKIGSREWHAGIDRDLRNDIWQAWRPAKGLRPLVFTPATMPERFQKYDATGAVNNQKLSVRDGWTTVPEGQTFSVLPKPFLGSGPFTVLVTWRLEQALARGEERLLWGAARLKTGSGDGESWWLTARRGRQGQTAVHLCTKGSPDRCRIVIPRFTAGEGHRTAVVYDGKSKLYAHDVSAAGKTAHTHLSSPDVRFPYLRVGSPRAGDRGPMSLSDDIIIARRAWTKSELATLQVGGPLYPWGF